MAGNDAGDAQINQFASAQTFILVKTEESASSKLSFVTGIRYKI